MAIKEERYLSLPDGREVSLYTLSRGGYSIAVSQLGCRLARVTVPSKAGPLDILLDYASPRESLAAADYLGFFIGRAANRIGKGRFSVDGQAYQLACNDGENHLHGGPGGFHTKVFRTLDAGGDHLTLALTSPDGQEGYPGTLELTVTWQLEEDGFSLAWQAAADRPTPAAFTNHAYWNLAGRDAGPEAMLATRLQLFAGRYTPVRPGLIPTGETRQVAGTPFDFTAPRPIGQQIDDSCPQLALGGGYDHNFCLDEAAPGALRPMACAFSPASGVRMRIETTLPGVQFYSGNAMTSHPPRSGFCLEPQTFPNAVNTPAFGQDVILRPGQVQRHKTRWHFEA